MKSQEEKWKESSGVNNPRHNVHIFLPEWLVRTNHVAFKEHGVIGAASIGVCKRESVPFCTRKKQIFSRWSPQQQRKSPEQLHNAELPHISAPTCFVTTCA